MGFRWKLFGEAAAHWSAHNGPRLGAALAYYTVLSLAPMLMLAIAICGRVFGPDAVRGQIYWEMKDITGPQVAGIVQDMLRAAYHPASGILATLAGLLVLLFSASAVFAELRDTLNYIWNAPAEPTTVWSVVRYRFVSLLSLCGAGLLLAGGLIFSVLLQAAGGVAARYVEFGPLLIEITNSIMAFVIVTIVFALIYKLIPEVPIDWKDVGLGALLTSALFVAGRFVLALYLGRAAVGSPYGAAGSVIVLLVWVYYSAQIFLYGAEVTYVYARSRAMVAGQSAVNIPAAPRTTK